jgi:acyl-CoA synthetase (NDP forming)
LINEEQLMSFQTLFYPRAVAVIGSVTTGKTAFELIRQLIAGGYNNVFAVNPKGKGVFSVPGYDSVSSIGEPVDLSIIASPAATVASVLEDCGKAGVQAVVIITSGFSETGNITGEEEIKQIAKEYGMRVVGPNCAGIVNTNHNLYATLETRPPKGEVAFISQSGAVAGAVLSLADEQGLGFSKFVSYGNRIDVDESELLLYLARDHTTKVVALYVESVGTGQGRKFMQALRECTRFKPVVVIKAGRTQSGARATLSHTSSMAGSDMVYNAALRECGAIRVKSIEEMLDVCKGFVSLPPVRGLRIAIVTNSGGPGVLAADAAEELGLQVAETSPAMERRICGFSPTYGSLKNPVDLTIEGLQTSYRETLITMLSGRAAYDMALALDVATPYLDSVPLAQGVCEAAARTGKPIVANFMAGQIVAASIARLKEHNIPNYPTSERAVTVLARLSQYYAQWNRHNTQRIPNITQFTEQSPLPFNGQMLEPDAMSWLLKNDFPVPDFRFAPIREEVAERCSEIGYPVVMKVVSPDILHKSDMGGVVLNISDVAEALVAFDTIQQSARSADFRGVIIYPMIRDAQEVFLGLSYDSQFGSVVVFGMGGIYTELLHDIALRVAPIDHPEAEEMIREIKGAKLLQGMRGSKPCDLDALAEVLVKFSQLPFKYPEIRELDLNPVFLFSRGLVVGDVRVITKKKED